MFHVEKYHRALIISIDKSHFLQLVGSEGRVGDGGWYQWTQRTLRDSKDEV